MRGANVNKPKQMSYADSGHMAALSSDCRTSTKLEPKVPISTFWLTNIARMV
jgi:hypothetical protein